MKNIKRFAAVFFMLLCILPALAAVPAFADCDVTVSDLDITVVLNEDGSATIDEIWNIDLISGNYSRFYHDISTYGVPRDEKFEGIHDVSVSINGTECEYTDDYSDRPDYHYYLSWDRPGARLDAYLATDSGTNTYEFRYTLDNIVKCVDDDYYLFVYRFIGADFQINVEDMTISVQAPDGCTPTVLYKTSGKETVSGSTVTITGKSAAEHMYKLRLRLDGGSIPGAQAISSSSLSNRTDRAAARRAAIWAAVGILFVLLIAFLIVRSNIRAKKLNATLTEKGLPYIQGLLMPLRAQYTPVELACHVGGQGKALLLQLMYMTVSGRLRSAEDAQGHPIILIPASDVGYDTREQALIRAMQVYCEKAGIPQGASGYTVSLMEFANFMRDNYDLKYRLDRDVYKPIHAFLKAKTQGRTLKKQLKEFTRAVLAAAKLNLLPAVTEETLLQYYADHETLLYYTMNNSHGDRTDYSDAVPNYWYWGYYYDSLHTSDLNYSSAHSSSNSGGGCSSCSSCGGCGGGGCD